MDTGFDDLSNFTWTVMPAVHAQARTVSESCTSWGHPQIGRSSNSCIPELLDTTC